MTAIVGSILRVNPNDLLAREDNSMIRRKMLLFCLKSALLRDHANMLYELEIRWR